MFGAGYGAALGGFGKNLESACKAHAYREYHDTEKLADKLAGEVEAAGGLAKAPKDLVEKFVAAVNRAEELKKRLVPDAT